MRSTRTALLVTTTLIALLLSGLGQAQEETDNSIQAQPLTNALAEFAEQTGMQLVYPSELTAGVDSNSASTEGTPDEILDQLLASTGLKYEYVNDRTIAIALVSDTKDQRGASDSKNSNPAPTLMAQNQTSQAQTTVSNRSEIDEEAQESESPAAIEEIIVTGTNIRGVENPTTPVLQFDREDIDLSGAATVEGFLRTIPQNFGHTSPLGQDSANDFNESSNFTNGTAVDLRGLGAGTTLTLLNGRRMTPSGFGNFVDISLLPLGAIERVDVLTDGASAVYGTDAVAGVVNFVTRKDFEGFEVSGRYGTVTEGSKEDYGVGAAGGYSWGGGGALFGVDYVDQQPLLSSERDFFDPDLMNPDGAVGAKSDRISAFASFNQDLTKKLSFAVDALYSNRESSVFRNFQPQLKLDSDQEVFFINSRLSYDLTPDVTASIYYDFGRDEASQVNSAQLGEIDFLDNTLHSVEAQLSGKLVDLPSGAPLSFALGSVYRSEKNEQSDNLGTPDRSRSRSRDIFAAYGELLIPIIGDESAYPFLKAFDISVAARYEDYSDFGDTFNPKIGVHLAPHSDWILRASYSTSFRAPDLTIMGQDETVFIVNFPNIFFTAFPAPGDNGSTPVISFGGGNPNIGPEHADVWSAGFEFTPSALPGLMLSTTYFYIGYEDRIEGVSVLELLQNPGFLALVDMNPDPTFVADVFARAQAGGFSGLTVVDPTISPEDIQLILNQGTQNIAVRDVEGLDINLKYSIDTDFGDFSASFNLAYLLKNDSQFTDLSDVVDDLNVLYRPVDLRLRGGLSWRPNGGFGVSGFVNHTRGYVDKLDRTIANDIDSWTTVDLAVSYDTSDVFDSTLLDGVKLSFHVQNVFDEDPPFVSTLDGFNYDTSNADPFGRFITASFSKTF